MTLQVIILQRQKQEKRRLGCTINAWKDAEKRLLPRQRYREPSRQRKKKKIDELKSMKYLKTAGLSTQLLTTAKTTT